MLPTDIPDLWHWWSAEHGVIVSGGVVLKPKDAR